MVHLGSATLLLSLAIVSILISVLIAVKPAADSANAILLKVANAVGLMEQLALGIVTLTGVVAAYVSSWSLSLPWLWMSLMIVVFYSVALEFLTKPARLAVAEGGSTSKVGLQVGLQVGHVLLLFVAFALMVLRPL
jgi:hypothetical protein